MLSNAFGAYEQGFRKHSLCAKTELGGAGVVGWRHPIVGDHIGRDRKGVSKPVGLELPEGGRIPVVWEVVGRGLGIPS